MARDSRRADPRRVVAVNGGGGGGDVATIRRFILDLVNCPMVTGRSMRCNPDEYCYRDCIHYSGLSAFFISFRVEKSTASSPPMTANKAFLAAGGHGDATMHRDRSKKAYVKAVGNDAVHLRVMYVLRRSALDIDLYNIKKNVKKVKFIINMAKVNMSSVKKHVEKHEYELQMDAISFTPLSRTFVKTFVNSLRLSQLPKNGTKRLIINPEHAKQTYLEIRLAKHRLLTHVEIIVTHLPLDSFQVGQRFSGYSSANLFHLTLSIVTIPTFIIDNIILIFEELHDWLNDDKAIIRRQCSAYKATTFPFSVRSPASLSLSGACRATALYCVCIRCIQSKLNFGMETDIEISRVSVEYHTSYRMKRGKGYEGNGKDGDFYR
ncbi:hypothetical protein ALC57_07839 [Trachymyrmex cornetzi]|uniref:Uncharacterized protein n=1 Tax=Trachymyrmex cornetzi TaxID=471704 RepID=A0A195E4L0_9HYME|nr:hypothetical protein ALC57_07839 [Trachymyrmex cornetzi]